MHRKQLHRPRDELQSEILAWNGKRLSVVNKHDAATAKVASLHELIARHLIAAHADGDPEAQAALTG